MGSDLPVQLIANRAGIVLLNNLEHNGAVGLGGLLHILLDLLDCPIMCNILLQHEVKSLTDTGCFYSLHNTVSALKNQYVANTYGRLPYFKNYNKF